MLSLVMQTNGEYWLHSLYTRNTLSGTLADNEGPARADECQRLSDEVLGHPQLNFDGNSSIVLSHNVPKEHFERLQIDKHVLPRSGLLCSMHSNLNFFHSERFFHAR